MNTRKKDHPEALTVRCPYCGSKPGEGCRVRQPHSPQYGRDYEPQDRWGWPLVHRRRVAAANELTAAA